MKNTNWALLAIEIITSALMAGLGALSAGSSPKVAAYAAGMAGAAAFKAFFVQPNKATEPQP